MHKKLVNELRLTFRIQPKSPLLIKSGQEAGANPTLLDMNFVRTYHAEFGETVYLPGSSLKGAVRSYCEKIGRTVGLNVCNPLDNRTSCGRRLEYKAKTVGAPAIYRDLCPICRLFGHTVMASHIHFSDAYPSSAEARQQLNRTSERDGVAIDRISGAVAVGPFQLEVVTRGEFRASLLVRNFQLWQVGLLAVALRDIGQQRVPIGFAKSRGLGRIGLTYEALEISYPGQFGQNSTHAFDQSIYGVTAFVPAAEYGFFDEAPVAWPVAATATAAWGRVSSTINNHETIEAVLASTVAPWATFVAASGGGT